MITVEEWRLRFTENVKTTIDRVAGAVHKASEKLTSAQEALKEGTSGMGRAAKQAGEFMQRVGGSVGTMFTKLKAGFRNLIPKETVKNAEKLALTAAEARTMWDDKGRFRHDRAGALFAARGQAPEVSALHRYIRNLLPKGVEDAFKTGGARGMAPLMGRLGGVARLALGPIGIAASLAGVVGAKSYAAVKAFEPAARELRLANMDKTPAQQSALRSQVLSTAAREGFNAQDTALAYTEVKRVMGGRDGEVGAFVAQVGRAAGALNMELMPMVASSAKAMKDFGLPLLQAKDLLDSNVKTMATAGVSYQTLASAQESYAAAARLANQQMGTANGMYAVFAVNGRDAAAAGGKLVQAMDQLARPKSTEGLKTIGVNVYDANGRLRQMDDVVRELVPAMARLNDEQFNELKRSIGGNGGLRDLLDLTRSSGEDVLATLNKFKDTSLGIDDQLQAARNDLDLLAKQVEERMNTAWIRVGEGLKPLFVTLKKGMAWALEGVADMLDPNSWIKNKAVADYKALRQRVMDMAAPASMGTLEERQRGMADLYRDRKDIKAAYDSSVASGNDFNAKRFKRQLEENQMAIVSAVEAWGKSKSPAAGMAPPSTADDAGGAGTPDPLKAGATAIVGGGKQVRNVNVTIQKLVEKLEVRTSTTVREGITSVRQEVEQAFIDIVRGGEAALANG